jgi:hypothetical protein
MALAIKYYFNKLLLSLKGKNKIKDTKAIVVAWPLEVSVTAGLARCIAYKDAGCPYLNSSSLRLGIFCSHS